MRGNADEGEILVDGGCYLVGDVFLKGLDGGGGEEGGEEGQGGGCEGWGGMVGVGVSGGRVVLLGRGKGSGGLDWGLGVGCGRRCVE